jgi:hypothetical protein
VPIQEQEKNGARGFKRVVDCGRQEAQGNKRHLISVRKVERESGAMKQGCKTPMKRNEKCVERSPLRFPPVGGVTDWVQLFAKKRLIL